MNNTKDEYNLINDIFNGEDQDEKIIKCINTKFSEYDHFNNMVKDDFETVDNNMEELYERVENINKKSSEMEKLIFQSNILINNIHNIQNNTLNKYFYIGIGTYIVIDIIYKFISYNNKLK